MIISVSKKKFFNSILPVLKSFSFREINDFVSFCFIFSFIPYEYWAGGGGGGAGGCCLPIISLSTLLLVINRFLSVEDVN